MSEQQAIVQEVEGEVSVTRNGEVVNIKSGDALLPGDQIVTGSTGRLSLEFPGLPGQDPATGVMTSNGKITLGEQEGANGPQMVVMEDEECFDFTSEITELSAVTEDVGAAGLFGGVAAFGAGGGLAAAGLGAVAAGMFLGGGGGGNDDPTTAQANAGGSAGMGGGLLSGDNGSPVGGVLDTLGLGGALGGAGGSAGGSAGGTTGGTTGGTAGGASGSPLQPLVTAINQTPLGEPAKPLTDFIVDSTGGKGSTGASTGGTTGGNTAPADPGPDNLIKAVQDTVGQLQSDPSKLDPATVVQNIVNAGQTDLKEAASSNVGPDHLVSAVQNTVSGLQSNPTGLDPAGTVQDLVSAGQKDLTELVSANPVNPADLVSKVVDAVNQTPLGEPLSPVTTALTDAVGQLPTDPLAALDGNSGIVSPIVEQLTNALSPVTDAAPQLTTVTDGLQAVAGQVDSVLNSLLDAGSGLGGGASALPLDSLLSAAPMGGANPLTGALGQVASALDGASSGANPLDGLVSTLQGGATQLTGALGGAGLPTGDLGLPNLGDLGLPTGDLGASSLGGEGGLLGTVQNLVSQLPTGGLGGGNPTDLLTTAANGISSAAADPSAPDLSAVTNVLGKLL